MSFERPVLIFDGICVLCSYLVRFVLWADAKKQYLDLATAQSEIGQTELSKRHLNSEDFDTVLLIFPNGSDAIKMDCVIEVGKILGGVWKLLYIFKIMPRKMRNALYDFVAQRRYKWFGKTPYCALIPEKYKDRIIQ